MAARISEEKLCSLLLDEAGDAERKALEEQQRKEREERIRQQAIEETKRQLEQQRQEVEAAKQQNLPAGTFFCILELLIVHSLVEVLSVLKAIYEAWIV